MARKKRKLTNKEIEEIRSKRREEHKKILLHLIAGKVREIKNLRVSLHYNIDNWRKHYNNEMVRRYFVGSSNVFIGATFEAVEVVKTIFMELLFPKGEVPFDVKPVEKSDTEKARDIIKPLLAFQAEKRIGLEGKAEDALHNYLVDGTAVCKVPWTYNTKWLKEKGEWVKDKKGKVKDIPTDDYPDLIPWDLKKVYYDPKAKRVEDLDMIVFESLISLDKLKRLDKKYNSKGIYEDTDELKEAEYQRVHQDWDKYEPHLPEVLLWECYLNYDLDEDGIAEEIVCTIANEKLTIRLSPTPYDTQEKPILICPLFPRKGAPLLGKGIPEALFEMQIQLNDTANQTLDDGTHIINNMWLYDQTKIDRPTARIALKSRPDGIVPVKFGDPRTAVTPLQVPNIMDSGLLLIKLYRDWMRSISMGEYSLQGLPAHYKPTATEYSGQQLMAMSRVKRYAKKFEREIIKKFLRKAYEYDMQFMSKKEFLKILGEKGAKYKKVPLQKLRIDCDFIPVGTLEMENKLTKITQLTNFLNVVLKAPLPVLLQLMRLNLGGIAEELAERFNLPKDRIFYEDPSPEMISPEDENELLKDGHKIFPKMQENHIRHVIVHARVKEAQQHLMDHQKMMMYIEQMARRQIGGTPTQEMPKGVSRTNIGQVEGTAGRSPTQF